MSSYPPYIEYDYGFALLCAVVFLISIGILVYGIAKARKEKPIAKV